MTSRTNEATEVADGGLLPLSFPQERFWLLHQLVPDQGSNRVNPTVRLKGTLDADVLERCVNELIARYAILRTCFVVVDGAPRQAVMPALELQLRRTDLRHLPAEQRDEAVHHHIHLSRREPFDLERGPLVRGYLLRLDDDEHVLFMAMHHIIMEGGSYAAWFRRLGELYAGFLAGDVPSAPVGEPQYRDFTTWQRARFESGALDEQVEYWRRQLAGCPSPVELPADDPAEEGAPRSGLVTTDLSGATLAGLSALREREGTSIFSVFVTLLKVLLHRYTGEQDLVMAIAYGRRPPRFQDVLGCFINTLLLRTDLSGDPGFRVALNRVHEVAGEAYRNAEVPFEKVVTAAGLRLAGDPSALLPVYTTYLSGRDTEVEMGPLRATRIHNAPEDAPFDLQPWFLREADRLRITWIYNARRYRESTIRRFSRQFVALARAVIAAPDEPISRLPLADDAETRVMLQQSGGARTDYPRGRCIHELFSEQARQTPDRVAASLVDGATLTYRELDERSSQLAHHLRGLGVGVETPVGIAVERSFEMLVGILGILKAGGAYVPLDPTYPSARLALMVEDSRPPVLLTQAHLTDRLPAFEGPVVRLDAARPEIARHPVTAPDVATRPESLAYVIYTSGSTGRPKGVLVEHRSVVRLVRDTDYVELGPDEVFLQFAPLSFDASTFELWGSLLNGARLVVFPPEAPSLEELGRVIQEQRVSVLWLTAALFARMVDEQGERLGGVRQLLAGGEALSPGHVRRYLSELGDRVLINGYGPTENTTFTCCHRMTRESEIGRTVPIGRPIANTTVYLLDESLNPVPVGVLGRLFTGGDGVARGYLGDEELTARRFRVDPFSDVPGARMYDVGDLARWRPDGTIEFLGRVDDQVKLRGFRIELGEIEAAISEAPGVRDAVVVLREGASGEKRLVGYVVLDGAGERDAGRGEGVVSDLRPWLRLRLPPVMIPAAIVPLNALPLTPNGKVDRDALPAPVVGSEASEPTAPRTPTEARVAEIYAGLLPGRVIGVHDDFIELGGDSLLAMRLMNRLRDDFGVDLGLATVLFDRPTVAAISAELDARGCWRRPRGDCDDVRL